MHNVLVTLRAHGDLTRIEFEDGLLRRSIPEQLDVESALFGIDADIRAERQTALGARDSSEGPTAVLTFMSLDEGEISAESVAGLVEPYATPIGGYLTDSTRYGDENARWIGHATPGTKLMCFLRSGGAADAFHESVASTAAELERAVGPGLVVVHRIRSQLFRSPDLDAVLTVRFPSPGALDEALASGLPELDSVAHDVDALTRLLVFEHRFHADPNHWGTAPTPPQ